MTAMIKAAMSRHHKVHAEDGESRGEPTGQEALPAKAVDGAGDGVAAEQEARPEEADHGADEEIATGAGGSARGGG